MTGEITGVLLAAGQGRRFGGNKLLHMIDDGQPMVLASARQLQAAVPRAIVVVDNPDGEVAGLLRREGLEVVANPRAAEGMGTSIARGVAASPGAHGWIIAMADMPYIPATLIRQLAGCLEDGASIVAPVYRGQRWHPVGIAARHAEEHMRLAGDEGARGIMRDHGDALVLIEVGVAGVVTDIDTPDCVESGRPRAR